LAEAFHGCALRDDDIDCAIRVDLDHGKDFLGERDVVLGTNHENIEDDLGTVSYELGISAETKRSKS
jgi:hypothetical protein